jgi:hypothetical protein
VNDTTFSDCGGPHELSFAHSKSSWESKPTTCAEQAVIRYLIQSPARVRGKSLLHVGVGNGALFAATEAELGAFTGVTISRPELDKFNHEFGGRPSARVILANKHDDRVFGLIGDRFDIIVDVNLKSFACCEKHFRTTMSYFARSLLPGGSLVTAQSGLDFGWAGNTAVAYTPGADTTPLMSVHRVLGSDGLLRLSADLGLAARSLVVQPSADCEAETLWILEKV